MKKRSIVLLMLSILSANLSYGQIPFNTIDSININNINASVLVHGDMWWNPDLEVAHCYFPKNYPASINFASSLWMSGYDPGGQLHIAAATYRQNGNDYWPGPISTGDSINYATSHAWAKIWKVNLTDILTFLGLSSHTIANTPASILTWPGKGNTYATGNLGISLTVTDDMAPFIDLNGNGIYEPLLGEFPDIKGDQALWWVFNDNGPSHNETKGKPLGVEVHAMCYGFHRNTLVDNVVFYEYYVANKSVNDYHNFRMGQFDDVDLGYYLDDFIGFDSSHRMGICYNGTTDDGVAGGHPLNSYGTSVPIVGLTMIVMPGDAGTSYAPAGSFTYYNNDLSIIGNPMVDTEYDHYLRSRIRSGAHFTNDFTGRGIMSYGHGAGPNCNYVYTGDPGDTTKWSECNCSNNPGDRRFIITSNDFTLNAGATQRIVMALVTTDTGAGGGCPDANFTNIKIVADTAWAVYQSTVTAGVSKISQQQYVNIYPNPAHDKLNIESMVSGSIPTIQVFNTLGQVMNVAINKNGNRYEADVSKLSNGLYDVLYRQDGIEQNSRFVKE